MGRLLYCTMDPVIFGLVLVLVINLIIFPIAYKLQTDKLTDITYALSFGILTVYGFMGGISITSVFKLMLSALLLAWAARLGLFLLDRVSKMGKDARFDNIRSQPIRFFKFFCLQAVSSWIISLPFLYRLFQDPSIKSGVGDVTTTEWIGLTVALIGFTMETMADAQKSSFKSIAGNEKKVFYGGLFRIVQYPNYTGEILFWVGIFIACTSSLSGFRWFTISSPLIIILLLVFYSGIPSIEKARKKILKDDPEYQAYKRRTSKLIPGIF